MTDLLLTGDTITQNKLNVLAKRTGVDASKGSPLYVGDGYFATDTSKLYISSNGTTWDMNIITTADLAIHAALKTSVHSFDANNILPIGYIKKIASTSLQNSHDAEASTTSETYVLAKTMTIGSNLAGTIRIKFDLKTNQAGATAYGKIYHNNVALGTEQSNATTSYVTYSEDITHNFIAGDTIQIYIHITSVYIAYVQNFRLYYDTIICVEDITNS